VLAWVRRGSVSWFLLDHRKIVLTNDCHFQLLNEHSKHEVHLYEYDNRPGGHANTFTFSAPGKEPVDVDGLVAHFCFVDLYWLMGIGSHSGFVGPLNIELVSAFSR